MSSDTEEPRSSAKESRSLVHMRHRARASKEPHSSVWEPRSSDIKEPHSSVLEPGSSNTEEPRSSTKEPCSSVQEPRSSDIEETQSSDFKKTRQLGHQRAAWPHLQQES